MGVSADPVERRARGGGHRNHRQFHAELARSHAGGAANSRRGCSGDSAKFLRMHGTVLASKVLLVTIKEHAMSLKHYFQISVLIFLVVIAATRYFSVPALPFALILLTGETLLGFQVEDHKASRTLKALFTPAKPHHR